MPKMHGHCCSQNLCMLCRAAAANLLSSGVIALLVQYNGHTMLTATGMFCKGFSGP